MKSIKNYILKLAPGLYFLMRDIYQFTPRLVTGEVRKIRAEADGVVGFDQAFSFTERWIKAFQVKSEIAGLIDFIAAQNPKNFVEIGTADGGTHFLIRKLCESIDKCVAIDTDIRNRYLLDRITATAQSHYIRGFSNSQKVQNAFKKIFPREQMLDVLFIDGDHSYVGVKGDFELYAKQVKSGGLIIFHDIVEDWGQRHGRTTNKYTGGVPKFYSEIKDQYEYKEFVDDPDQDGFGIGVIIQR